LIRWDLAQQFQAHLGNQNLGTVLEGSQNISGFFPLGAIRFGNLILNQGYNWKVGKEFGVKRFWKGGFKETRGLGSHLIPLGRKILP